MTQNVDQQEIEKFSQVAEQWWQPNGEFKPLHQINPLRLAFIEQYASLAEQDVLDVGCGGGILSEALARQAKSVLGIDMAEKSLQIAQAHAESEGLANLEYRCISVEDLAAEMPERFPIITCMEMLEHVPDPASIIRACARLAQSGGILFFSTLNRNSQSYLQAILGAEYVLRLMQVGTHDWHKFITPAELARMCRQSSLNLLATQGLSYNPLSQHYFLTPSTKVNYMIACQKR